MTPSIASTNTLELSPLMVTGQKLQVAESIRLAAVTERSQDFTLTTKEGDTVTLSLDQSNVAVYGRDGRLSQIQQKTIHAGNQTDYESQGVETREWFGMESSQEFTLTIDGDLSEVEMEDIRKALYHIHQLMAGTFGVGSAAPAKGYGLSGLDTLDGIEVDIKESRFIMASRSTHVSLLTNGTDAQAALTPDVLSTPDQLAWQTAADKAVGIVKETGIAARNFARPLANLFRHWSGKMRRHHRAFEPMVQMMAKTVFNQLQIVPTEIGQE